MTIPLAKITKTILVIVVLGAMMLSSACILVDVEDDAPSPEATELPTNTHYVTPTYEPTLNPRQHLQKIQRSNLRLIIRQPLL